MKTPHPPNRLGLQCIAVCVEVFDRCYATHLRRISTLFMMLTTISYNPSSILITRSLFLLTLIRSSFSSLDSARRLHSTLARLHHYGATCILPNYLSMFPFHLVSYTHNTQTFPSYPPTPFLFRSPAQHSNCPLACNCPNAALKNNYSD